MLTGRWKETGESWKLPGQFGNSHRTILSQIRWKARINTQYPMASSDFHRPIMAYTLPNSYIHVHTHTHKPHPNAYIHTTENINALRYGIA